MKHNFVVLTINFFKRNQLRLDTSFWNGVVVFYKILFCKPKPNVYNFYEAVEKEIFLVVSLLQPALSKIIKG